MATALDRFWKGSPQPATAVTEWTDGKGSLAQHPGGHTLGTGSLNPFEARSGSMMYTTPRSPLLSAQTYVQPSIGFHSLQPVPLVQFPSPERLVVQQQPIVQYVQGPQRIVEVPGPQRVIVQQQPLVKYVQGPERIVAVPGPERIVYLQGKERIIQVQGPERVVEVERVVESAPVRLSGCGVGLAVEKDARNRAVVAEVLRGGPADGKVFVGDVIVDIDGFPTERIPEENSAAYFVGDEGTVITLGILSERIASAMRRVTLVRQPVEMVGTVVRASSPLEPSRISNRISYPPRSSRVISYDRPASPSGYSGQGSYIRSASPTRISAISPDIC